MMKSIKDRKIVTPCNGCTLCCKNDAVRIYDFEDASQWKTEPHFLYPNERMLAHKSNHDCYYLGENGCTIQETKPYMCKTGDCRLLTLKVSFDEAKESKRINFYVWKKGQQLLKKTDKKTLKQLKKIAKG
jgi:Fe-S-cluster containining protein